MTKRWGSTRSDLTMSKRDAHKKARAEDKLELFLEKQEPLGKEFEAVLFDNLWDLYAR